MRRISICLLAIIVTLFACDNDVVIPKLNIREILPVYRENQIDNVMIPDSEIKNKVLVLNSVEAVEANISKSFLQKYSEYLLVDFDKYSLLVQTSIIDYNVLDRNISVFWDDTSESYRFRIDYLVDRINENSSVERIAVVIDKISEKNKIIPESSITLNR